MKRFLFAAFGMFLSMVAAAAAMNSARAEDNPLLGSFGDWQAFKTKQGGKDVCLVSSKPSKSLPEGAKRGDIFFLISHFQEGGVRNQVQILIGYPFKAGSTAKVKIGGQTFELFTDGENAWARETATDEKIVQAMRKGANAVITGTSQRGTETTDTFSLKGISAALDAIGKACNL
ncbi:MAG: invasion associated locus B family protein [Zavarzinia sp.]|nr:invasion associated locus B family protein [Zavarzinia sp.]